MGLEIAKLRKTCNLCKERRSQRYCLRYGKDICWVCCNKKRIDKKCPQECSYILQRDSEQHQPLKTKIDSYSEHIDLIKLEIDRWVELPEKQFANRIPLEMAAVKEGQVELEEYVTLLDKLPLKVIAHLRERLKLPPQQLSSAHYEDIACNYLDKIIAQDWEGSLDLMCNNSRFDDRHYRDNYITRRSGNRLLKQTTSYHLILSAISEKGDEALVYFEVNGKYDLTMHLVNESVDKQDNWKLCSLILSHPQMFYSIPEVEGQIYDLLNRNELEQAHSKLKTFSEIYIDSKEVFYIYGLYYALQEDYQKGGEMFLTCAELDPGSYDYRYNYAFSAMMTGNKEQAKIVYQKLLEEKPDDIKTINNMAVIYLNENNFTDAKKMWKRCLEVDPEFEPAQKNLERFSGL